MVMYQYVQYSLYYRQYTSATLVIHIIIGNQITYNTAPSLTVSSIHLISFSAPKQPRKEMKNMIQPVAMRI